MDKKLDTVSVSLREDAEPIIFETGWKAKQANGSIWIRQGGTVILVTATGRKDASDGVDFFPLTVNYVEKFYAVGKVPGGFLKRENKPSDKETLIARLIDRPLRPMFPDGFRNETQVIATVVSYDGKHSPDVLSINAASAALLISDIPFSIPVAGVRVGKHNGQLIINPSYEIFSELTMNIVVAGSDDAINMVEAGMEMVTEEEVVEALQFAHDQIKILCSIQKEFAEKCGKQKFEYKDFSVPAAVLEEAEKELKEKINAALVIPGKLEKYAALDKVRDEYFETVEERLGEEYADKKGFYKEVWHHVEKKVFRDFSLDSGKRIDGRTAEDVRPIDIETHLLPMPHGSALFTRGETQALAVATLGTKTDTQMLDNIEGESKKRFMLHYNFPPFCVGEVGFLRGPGRREIGHGALAERALLSILPAEADFPYSLRIVSEVLESNGSSSMATVCGGCLSLMDAGVPVKDVVAGVAMGLIKEGDRYIILSDIMGTEDHLGDMDFKVAGTENGITALQMDIKIEGLSRKLLEEALAQAKRSRLHILGKMKEALPTYREELAETAPRYQTLRINPEKIGLLIGPGGKNIKAIVEDTGAQIDIDDSGQVNVFAVSKEAIEAAIARINGTVQEVELDKVYQGKVKKIMDYGAFVEIIPGVEALLHVSQYSNERINSIADVLKLGEIVEVKYLGKDQNGRHKISRKVLL
ncbi:polyribonucleotide nucleotidyltransferase [Geovibrio ferrireducens]|uniref:polyribonucleotide nucleotidyltransferase n=1 Tax=Geovibrio ferrireducens TaxID=46201 RepID=UPI002246D8E0|nr:polyribonucleotide nucleotidyltransferase [Geovibrio ferrireducens]